MHSILTNCKAHHWPCSAQGSQFAASVFRVSANPRLPLKVAPGCSPGQPTCELIADRWLASKQVGLSAIGWTRMRQGLTGGGRGRGPEVQRRYPVEDPSYSGSTGREAAPSSAFSTDGPSSGA